MEKSPRALRRIHIARYLLSTFIVDGSILSPDEMLTVIGALPEGTRKRLKQDVDWIESYEKEFGECELKTNIGQKIMEIARTCWQCKHRKTIMGESYCASERPDLKPAFGQNHPLKRLPQERGITCSFWEK